MSVWVISPSGIAREGLKRVLAEESLEVTGTCSNYHHLKLGEMCGTSDALLVIVDQPASAHNLEACEHVRTLLPACKLVIFSDDCERGTVTAALNAGIDGYIGKHVSCATFAGMLRLVALGEKVVPAQIFEGWSATGPALPISSLALDDHGLSDRELEVLQCLIRGDANKVIARQLAIADTTVKVHIKAILRKLSVSNRTQAAVWASTQAISSTFPTVPMKLPAASSLSAGKHLAFA